MRTLGCCKRSSLQHKDLRVERNQAEVRPRTLYRLSRVAPDSGMGINNNDIGTIESALLERMYFCKVDGKFVSPPCVLPTLVDSRLHRFRRQLLKYVRHSTPVDYQQFVDMFKGRKRTIYSNALRSIQEHDVCRKDAESKAFVKCEMVNLEKAARIIQPRDPRYNLCLGAYIKPLEHKIYRAIDRICGTIPTVMKGYNVEQVGSFIAQKWALFREPVAAGLDATKFDMHVNEAQLGWEHSIYLAVYQGCTRLKRLLKWQMNNRGGAYADDGKLKYKVKGKRFSGDMNTALGNVILMCGMVWEYCLLRGVRVEFVNNGDDVVVILEKSDLSKFMTLLKEWFFEVGHRIVVEKPVYQLQEIEFCQMHPIRLANGWTMVRNIPTALIKDSKITCPIRSEHEMKCWMTAVGEGGLSVAGGVPILQNLYRRYQLIGGGCRNKYSLSVQAECGMALLSRGMRLGYTKPLLETREDVEIAWGITASDQAALETYYDTLDIGYDGEVVSSPEPLMWEF